MRKFAMLVALAAAVTASPALTREKPDQPREKKVCRTVQMSGRITPQRICRKVERPAAEESQRTPRQPDGSGDRGN